jgi:hypothetical protein
MSSRSTAAFTRSSSRSAAGSHPQWIDNSETVATTFRGYSVNMTEVESKRVMKRLAYTVIMFAVACTAAFAANQLLLAKISVTRSIEANKQPHVIVNFELVNTGISVSNPAIANSLIVVDGEPLQDSASILGSGLRDSGFETLPPDHKLKFSHQLDEYFKTPGKHTVMWKGRQFQSNVVVVDVSKSK